MTRSTRLPLRLVVIAATTIALVAAAPVVMAVSPRSGDLYITKECSEFTGQPGGFCTITSSNINAIQAGSRVVYASGLTPPTLDSDITIVRNGNSIAQGHVQLNLLTGTGTVTLSGGTGQFLGFEANVVVTCPGGPSCSWAGSYSFSPPGSD
jgi:hypothetical protein